MVVCQKNFFFTAKSLKKKKKNFLKKNMRNARFFQKDAYILLIF